MLKMATMVKHAPIAAPITVIKTLDGVISPHGQQKNTLIVPELRLWLNWQLSRHAPQKSSWHPSRGDGTAGLLLSESFLNHLQCRFFQIEFSQIFLVRPYRIRSVSAGEQLTVSYTA